MIRVFALRLVALQRLLVNRPILLLVQDQVSVSALHEAQTGLTLLLRPLLLPKLTLTLGLLFLLCKGLGTQLRKVDIVEVSDQRSVLVELH